MKKKNIPLPPLSLFCLFDAAIQAVNRQITTVNSKVGFVGDLAKRWGGQIFACFAEYAFAKLAGLPWTGRIPLSKADVGTDWQVRNTGCPTGRLIVKMGDDPNMRYALVTGEGNSYVARGWMWGRDAKQQRYYQIDHNGPAYWVPQIDLLPFDLDEFERNKMARTLPAAEAFGKAEAAPQTPAA